MSPALDDQDRKYLVFQFIKKYAVNLYTIDSVPRTGQQSHL